ncbi:MAG TPA: hypothetical protein VMR02_08910 [Terracidiphilus sp.]|jgi:hypothetical protein|nr:hypothetical protein [Terracidiphilus sp.]
MSASRQRNAWIWLAVAAMAVATLARAQAGIQVATAYANPVFEFLVGHQGAGAHAAIGAPRRFERRSMRQSKGPLLFASAQHGADCGAWEAVLLPVLFIGLVTPLNLISSRSVLSLGRTPSTPALPFSFQRPPPSLV